ncbi:PadR family transcriptional regulator, partial [Candidatus Bathyarchaeota archaeon]
MPGSGEKMIKRPTIHGALAHPQGIPRGFLRLYVLHRIAARPAHGYGLLQEIENKTEGVWRPGAGSIYPILKEL